MSDIISYVPPQGDDDSRNLAQLLDPQDPRAIMQTKAIELVPYFAQLPSIIQQFTQESLQGVDQLNVLTIEIRQAAYMDRETAALMLEETFGATVKGLAQIATSIEKGEVGKYFLALRLNAALKLDDSPDHYMIIKHIAEGLASPIDSEDYRGAQLLCKHISTEKMRKELRYLDIDFCNEERMAEYLLGAADYVNEMKREIDDENYRERKKQRRIAKYKNPSKGKISDYASKSQKDKASQPTGNSLVTPEDERNYDEEMSVMDFGTAASHLDYLVQRMLERDDYIEPEEDFENSTGERYEGPSTFKPEATIDQFDGGHIVDIDIDTVLKNIKRMGKDRIENGYESFIDAIVDAAEHGYEACEQLALARKWIREED